MERTEEIPPELARLFRKENEAKMLWSELAFTHRKEFAQWISGAKQEETRERRAAKGRCYDFREKNSLVMRIS
jgi:uncharacterized protein YdeI (YjbR/CyaY-like superfamily)